jgi:hypothetical protein
MTPQDETATGVASPEDIDYETISFEEQQALADDAEKWREIVDNETYDNFSDQQSRENRDNHNTNVFMTNRIFGSPYMLLQSVDPLKPGGNGYGSGLLGQDYFEDVLLNSTILTLKIGKPKYNGTHNFSLAGTLAKSLADVGGGSENAMENVLFGAGMRLLHNDRPSRFYGFKNDYYSYIKIVVLLITTMYTYLEIGDLQIPMLKYSGSSAVWEMKKIADFELFDWYNYSTAGYPTETMTTMYGDIATNFQNAIGAAANKVTDAFMDLIGYTDFQAAQAQSGMKSGVGGNFDEAPRVVQFMVEPMTATSETFNNSMTKSMMDKADETLNNIGKEIAWINSAAPGSSLTNIIQGITGDLGDVVQSLTMNDPLTAMIGSGVVGMLRGLSGERMLFPRIYDSSTFSRSPRFSMKLVSPYGNKYSYFIDCMLPLCFLIAAVAPRMTSANAYAAPFICQAYVPGHVACGLGIIESLSISKASDATNNNIDNLPLAINVELSITDLYDEMPSSAIDDLALFYANQPFIEYLAGYSNVDIWDTPLNDQYLFEILNKQAGALADSFLNLENIAERMISDMSGALNIDVAASQYQ